MARGHPPAQLNEDNVDVEFSITELLQVRESLQGNLKETRVEQKEKAEQLTSYTEMALKVWDIQRKYEDT